MQKRNKKGEYRPKRKWKLKLSALVVIGVVGYVLIDTPSTITYELPLITQDPVETYFENKLNNFDIDAKIARGKYKRQLELEEKAVRMTLQKENDFVEFQNKYKPMQTEYVEKIDDLTASLDLVAKMDLSADYKILAEKTRIKEIK